MRTPARAFGSLLALTLASLAQSARAQPIVVEGEVAAGEPDHQFLPFEVPEGTLEIEIRHDSLVDGNIIDWGLYDPAGFRGWGGGLKEPTVVGVAAASRGYVAGPLPAGTWQIVLGKAQISAAPAAYRAEIELRAAPTLPPQPERQPYVAPAPLATGGRFWPGDFHVHSRESGDARPTLDEVLAFAEARGLSFVELSDHNTVSQLDFYNDAQARHPNVLLLPGVEYTTYDGHANGIGATTWVDHKIGFQGLTIEAAAAAFRDQGAVFALNHPTLNLGDSCIGCAWRHDLDLALVGAYEIGIGGWDATGQIFTPSAIDQWTEYSARAHLAPIGGSDDHRGGVDLGLLQSPIGSPTTLVWAEELSVQAIVEGVRNGKTVVKLRGPQDPMIEFRTTGEPSMMMGDTVRTPSATLVVIVTGGVNHQARIVKAGVEVAKFDVTSDPFRFELPVCAPAAGEDFYRAEVYDGEVPRTITGHIYVAASPDSASCNGSAAGSGGTGGEAGTAGGAGAGGTNAVYDFEGGCALRRPLSAGGAGRGGALLAGLAFLAGLAGRARRRRRGPG